MFFDFIIELARDINFGFKELFRLYHQLSGLYLIKVNSLSLLLSREIIRLHDEILCCFLAVLDEKVIHEMAIQLLKVAS
jgi:hypothetical protein